MINVVGTTVIASAVGVVLGLVFSRVSAGSCIDVGNLELCGVDDVRAMLVGGLVGGAAGFLWTWRR